MQVWKLIVEALRPVAELLLCFDMFVHLSSLGLSVFIGHPECNVNIAQCIQIPNMCLCHL